MLFEKQGYSEENNFNTKPIIKVVGVGGGSCFSYLTITEL